MAFLICVKSDFTVPPDGWTYSTCWGATLSSTSSGSPGPSGNQPRQVGFHIFSMRDRSLTSSALPAIETFAESLRKASHQRPLFRPPTLIQEYGEAANRDSAND